MATPEDLARELGRLLRALWEGVQERGRAEESIEAKGFPDAGVDGFLSRFIITLRFHSGDLADQLISFALPAAVQSVARSTPFIYQNANVRLPISLPVPESSGLRREVTESDFLTRPSGVFEPGRETVWLQILNLDARGETPLGPVRIILGETFLREYPDVFQPSFGVAQSLSGRGFPARLLFSPNAVIETPAGALKTRPKALVGETISEFPPIGSFPSLLEPVALDSVDQLRQVGLSRAPELTPVATIQALSHPVEASLLGGNPFEIVQQRIGAGS